MIRAEIMSVGDEVVSGQIVDSNAAWLSRRLVDLGISVVAHVAVAPVCVISVLIALACTAHPGISMPR